MHKGCRGYNTELQVPKYPLTPRQRTKGGAMASIKINKCKVMGVKKEGLTRAGMPYRMFNVSEGFKQQDGGYKQIYFNCFAQGDECKKVEEGAILSIDGFLTPNIYKDKNGKVVYSQTLFIKEIINNGFNKGTLPKEHKEDEEPIELPFD